MLRCKTAPDPKDYVALPPPKYGGPTAETSLTTEPSCKDEARVGQKNTLTRVWGQTGSRPVAPKDLGFASAYVFGAVCPAAGKAAALIMPICNTAAMNYHLGEISGQVAAPRFREGRLCPCRGDPRRGGLASQPRACGARQCHLVGAAALQPGAQSGRAGLALPAQPLARQLGISQSGGYHDACETAWNRFAANHALIHSLCAVSWAPSPAH